MHIKELKKKIEKISNIKRFVQVAYLKTAIIIFVVRTQQSYGGLNKQGDVKMAKKVTSKKVASIASKVLRDNRTSKASKSAAASALSQREKRKQSADLRPQQTI